jgi:hypothetical protein
MDIGDALLQLGDIAKAKGPAYLAKTIVDGCQNDPLPNRRKAVLFLSGLLGHNAGHEFMDLGSQLMLQCRNCQMTAQVGKTRGVQGRLVEFECPASKRKT